MNDNIPLFTLNLNWDTALSQVTSALEKGGLQVLRSFDLRAARAVYTDYSCPHHGTAGCDCQLVVLLVYEENQPPVTLVAQGYDQQSSFFLVDVPSVKPSPRLGAAIRGLFHSRNLAKLYQHDGSHAA